MTERSRESPVEVTTIVGYDGIVLNQAIHDKEVRAARLLQEINELQEEHEKLIREIMELRRRFQYLPQSKFKGSMENERESGSKG